MSADARPRIEGLESERLGLRGVDGGPQVDAELVGEHGHLVHQGDVDVAVGVLEQLGHLRLAGADRRDHGVDDLAVELDRASGALLGEAANDLRGVADAVHGIARVDALRRVGEVEVDPRGEPTLGLENRADDVVGRTRIGRGLQHHERAGAQGVPDRQRGRGHRTEVGRGVLTEGGRHTDHDDIGDREGRGVRSGDEAVLVHRHDVGVGQVVDVAVALVEPGDGVASDVEAGDVEPGGHCLLGERHTDIAEADDGEFGGHHCS